MINQNDVNRRFLYAFEGHGDEWCLEDCPQIVDIIKKNLNLNISIAEAYEFWSFHSRDWEASWLTLPADEFVITFFKEYVEMSIDKDE